MAEPLNAKHRGSSIPPAPGQDFTLGDVLNNPFNPKKPDDKALEVFPPSLPNATMNKPLPFPLNLPKTTIQSPAGSGICLGLSKYARIPPSSAGGMNGIIPSPLAASPEGPLARRAGEG